MGVFGETILKGKVAGMKKKRKLKLRGFLPMLLKADILKRGILILLQDIKNIFYTGHNLSFVKFH